MQRWQKGFFPEEILYIWFFAQNTGHPDMHKSLGRGKYQVLDRLSITTGMARSSQNNMGSKVYVVMGDGEHRKTNWEAAAAAAHYG